MDVGALGRLIDHVAGISDALLIGDMSWGEGVALHYKTRLETACAVLEIVRGRRPVLVTITSPSKKETRDLLGHIEAFIERSAYPGTLFWVDYPIYYHGNRGLPQWYESMARDTRFNFILGNHAGLLEWRRKPIKHKKLGPRLFGY